MNAETPVMPFLPYGRQVIEEDDIAAVREALMAPLLTTGPLVERFEQALAASTAAREAVVVSNGTAALHLAARAIHLDRAQTAIVPSVTFVATDIGPRVAGLVHSNAMNVTKPTTARASQPQNVMRVCTDQAPGVRQLR